MLGALRRFFMSHEFTRSWVCGAYRLPVLEGTAQQMPVIHVNVFGLLSEANEEFC